MSTEASFVKVIKQVESIVDFIISDLKNGYENTQKEETLQFKEHLVTTRYWFSRISNANKKRFLIALVKDIRSASALSLLLKSIWNCRPKDAVLSTSSKSTWSRYDQAPMDHNRTALPLTMLAKVIKSDREWFQTLEPEPQASFLLELLSIAGGPIMWEVLQKAKAIYDKYRKDQLLNIRNSMAVAEKYPPSDPKAAVSILPSMILKAKSQKSLTSHKKGVSRMDTHSQSKSVIDVRTKSVDVPAKVQLQQRLNEWNSVIKSMKASFKLVEIETSFKDGSKNRIWKVNRTSPEGTETVDFVQLLPGVVAKRILGYLPPMQLASCSQVNKYWAYLIDDMKQEKCARLQLEIVIMKLENYVYPAHIGSSKAPRSTESRYQRFSRSSTTKILHGAEFDHFDPTTPIAPRSSPTPSLKEKLSICRASTKTSSSTIIKKVRNDRKPKKDSLPPIRNMAAMSENLYRRGALDDNLWKWCDAELKRGTVDNQPILPALKQGIGGVMAFNTRFPGPLMAKSKQKVKQSEPASATVNSTALNPEHESSWPHTDSTSKKSRQISLWSRDFSRLYPAYKIASYQSPM